MPMRAEVRWEGRRLWTERGRQAASEGLARALEHGLGVSNQRVPLREGTLERSGKVTVEGLNGAISYDTVYAVRQHEELDWQHLPGRRAKYLESSVLDERTAMLALMAVPIRLWARG
ncbi:hypothetical protein [Streptomyces sp. NPDC020983]|uniref:hypothetical protein n=1 Tax=Streptomyces sp. NPDC020983 TaxID=3365106 RepID=UPI0037B2748B